ncbi:MAG: hypothetical protein WDN00_17145 [Limisphaerales bacterium]
MVLRAAMASLALWMTYSLENASSAGAVQFGRATNGVEKILQVRLGGFFY